mgnify:CR=1 FL=1
MWTPRSGTGRLRPASPSILWKLKKYELVSAAAALLFILRCGGQRSSGGTCNISSSAGPSSSEVLLGTALGERGFRSSFFLDHQRMQVVQYYGSSSHELGFGFYGGLLCGHNNGLFPGAWHRGLPQSFVPCSRS